MAVVRPSGWESNLSLSVTASVFLSELGGQGNQNGSGGDEKMDAPQSHALNLTMPYKKRVGCDLPHYPSPTLSCPVCLRSHHPKWDVWLCLGRRREGQVLEGLINAIFVRVRLRWPEHPVTNRIKNTPSLHIGLTRRLCSHNSKRAIYSNSDVTRVQMVKDVKFRIFHQFTILQQKDRQQLQSAKVQYLIRSKITLVNKL